MVRMAGHSISGGHSFADNYFQNTRQDHVDMRGLEIRGLLDMFQLEIVLSTINAHKVARWPRGIFL